MKDTSIGPKKLLIVVNFLNTGGAEHIIYELVKCINKEKYSPEILCCGCRLGNSLEDEIEKVCKVNYIGWTGKIKFKLFKKVLSSISRIKPDIVHAQQGGVTFAIPWCALHRVPICIAVHSKPQRAFSKNSNRLVKLSKYINKTKFIAVSKENLTLVQKYYRVNDKKSEYINNGIDIEHFYRKEHGCFTFINVARQDENKNQIALIRAMAEILKSGKKARLILAGDGPCHESLKSKAEELGISESVLFTGHVADPAPYYAESDVYVQTSFNEALPLSVLEAMATGLPIIATDVGGLKDVVDKNGILIDAGDDNALLMAMNKIMDSSPLEYESMAIESKNKVENYSSVRMAEKYEQAYDKLLAKRK